MTTGEHGLRVGARNDNSLAPQATTIGCHPGLDPGSMTSGQHGLRIKSAMTAGGHGLRVGARNDSWRVRNGNHFGTHYRRVSRS